MFLILDEVFPKLLFLHPKSACFAFQGFLSPCVRKQKLQVVLLEMNK